MYEHCQKSPIHLVLHLISATMLVVAWSVRGQLEATITVLVFAAIMSTLGLCFKTLTVSDEGNQLRVKFGPIGLFGTTIDYRDITAVEESRTALIDGWGIHYVPMRGWTINIWGYECVKILRGDSVIRLGTDDAANLVRFLEGRIKSR